MKKTMQKYLVLISCVDRALDTSELHGFVTTGRSRWSVLRKLEAKLATDRAWLAQALYGTDEIESVALFDQDAQGVEILVLPLRVLPSSPTLSLEASKKRVERWYNARQGD